ncbi:MAG: Fic family protein, partial [Bacteroidia bacterium]|nr:Fic family protein [Bacteroidia bacterium]
MSEEQKPKYLDFDQYIRQGEPDRKERAETWRVAIGLQAVDGLTTSEYLQDTARRNIEGEISIDEARELIKSYYQSKQNREPDEDEKQEADKVSANIAKILSTDTLDFSVEGLVSLHRRIFTGIFKHAGEVRDYDISKKEWVLEGDSVSYLNWEDLRRALEYDIEKERSFSYKGLSQDDMISHISAFVSGIWQIHPFREGNTRATAVFTIQYLRSVGFRIDNSLFANHSWYFRNALVRANYKNLVKGIDYSPVYLERFFRNLLLGEQWDLRNRYLHINPSPEWRVQPNLAEQPCTGHTDTGQVQDTLSTITGQAGTGNPSSTHQVPHKYPTSWGDVTGNTKRIVCTIGTEELSVNEMLARLGLKDRKNFSALFLA